jgi:hypothetical protein
LPAYTFGVRQINVHPYFKFTPQADRFDVAVLQLERPVHYMPHICKLRNRNEKPTQSNRICYLLLAPICLPEKNEVFLGKFGWAAGWGALNPGSRLRPKTLQAVDVPVIENKVCERWHRANGINVVIYPEMLCAGYRNGIRIVDELMAIQNSFQFKAESFDSPSSLLTFFLSFKHLCLFPLTSRVSFPFHRLPTRRFICFLFIRQSHGTPFSVSFITKVDEIHAN